MGESTPGAKRCGRCGETKPLDDFGLNRTTKSGRQSWCKPCKRAISLALYHENGDRHRAMSRVSYKRNRDRLAARNRNRSYGLAPGTIERMLEEQDGKCACCGTDISFDDSHVDHDTSCCSYTRGHISRHQVCGKCVRGVLCRRCNIGLGYYEERAELFAAYLNRWRA